MGSPNTCEIVPGKAPRYVRTTLRNWCNTIDTQIRDVINEKVHAKLFTELQPPPKAFVVQVFNLGTIVVLPFQRVGLQIAGNIVKEAINQETNEAHPYAASDPGRFESYTKTWFSNYIDAFYDSSLNKATKVWYYEWNAGAIKTPADLCQYMLENIFTEDAIYRSSMLIRNQGHEEPRREGIKKHFSLKVDRVFYVMKAGGVDAIVRQCREESGWTSGPEIDRAERITGSIREYCMNADYARWRKKREKRLKGN